MFPSNKINQWISYLDISRSYTPLYHIISPLVTTIGATFFSSNIHEQIPVFNVFWCWNQHPKSPTIFGSSKFSRMALFNASQWAASCTICTAPEEGSDRIHWGTPWLGNRPLGNVSLKEDVGKRWPIGIIGTSKSLAPDLVNNFTLGFSMKETIQL